VQQRVGLHHLCLRARSREDVDKCAALLSEIGASIVRGPAEDTWAPGYYSVLFEDPDGIRLEVNFVPSGCRSARGGNAISPRPTEYGLRGTTPMVRAAARWGKRCCFIW
jgi:hypothetical protein